MKLASVSEAGLYSVGVRVASAMVLLLTAFRMAWPAFAYSISDEREARRTYAYVLTYLTVVTAWVALALTLLVAVARRPPRCARGSPTPHEVVGPLAFATVSYAAYIVIAIGVGRARRTQFNWVVTGAAAAVNVALNFALIPRLRDDRRRDRDRRGVHDHGASGWRGGRSGSTRCRTSGAASRRRRSRRSRSRRSGKELDVGLGAAVVLALAYPLALAFLGFTSAGGAPAARPARRAEARTRRLTAVTAASARAGRR